MNIRDVAKLAGVSASTVSKVMNGKDKDISEETRQKVLQVIEKENYIPYFRFLEKEGIKNYLIGLIVKRNNREREQIIMTAEREARKQGYGLVIGYVDSEEEIEQVVSEMLKKKISGLIIDSTKFIPSGNLEETTVYINETKEFDINEKAVVYYRMSEAAKLATNELIEAGHQKIACVFCKGETSIVNGYKLAMQYKNLKIQNVWIYEGQQLEDIEKYGIPQIVSEKITAIVCGTPEIACSIYKVLDRSRTVIPNEVSLISVGDDPILSLLGCEITAVNLPSREMTETSIQYLVEMIQKEKRIEVIKRLASEVIVRKSVMGPAKGTQGEPIVVVGSMNMDVTVEANKIPAAGETRIAKKMYTYSGGKGANQAVGVGKLGGQVYMIGCLGNDLEGKQIYSDLVENQVQLDGVLFNNSFPTGKAFINVDEQGESSIISYPGANQKMSINQIKRCKYLFDNAKYCLLSLEIPEVIVECTLKICRQTNTEVILKPAPAEAVTEKMLKDISYFIPNEKELNILVSGNELIEEKAEKLLDLGVKNVIVTLGKRGCYLKNKDLSIYFKGCDFEAVDTTGGADSFISALAVYLSEGHDLIHSIKFAIYASGICVTRYGVQPALPNRKAVDIYEDEIYLK